MQKIIDDLKEQLQNHHDHIILVGYDGCGKKNIANRIAKRMALPYINVEHEIEKAADRTIKEIIDDFGIEAYHQGAFKVIERLLQAKTSVFVIDQSIYNNPDVKDLLTKQGVTVWINNDPERANTSRTGHNAYHDEAPKEQTSHDDIHPQLLVPADDVFGSANLHILSYKGPCSNIVRRTLRAIARHVGVLKEHH